MVSTRPPTFQSSSPFCNPLLTVLNEPITFVIIVTCMFHSFINSLARSRYLSFFCTLFCGQLGQQSRQFSKITFLLITIRYGLLAEIKWSVCMSMFHRSLCVLFSRTGAGLCIYHLFVWSNLNFLHIAQGITLPTQSCLVLYSFSANLLHSLVMRLIVLSLSPHSIHLLFCCVLKATALKFGNKKSSVCE